MKFLFQVNVYSSEFKGKVPNLPIPDVTTRKRKHLENLSTDPIDETTRHVKDEWKDLLR